MTAPLRFSTLKHIARSPLHYQHALTTTFEPTPAMRLGTAVHQIVLGGTSPEPTKPKPVVYEGQRRGNAWKEFQAANPGVEIITIAEFERELEAIEAERAQAQRIADAVLGDMRVQRILEGAVKEQRITTQLRGREFGGTPDVLKPSEVWDLKTTNDASLRNFVWDARRRHYFEQVTIYGDLARAAKVADPTEYGLIAVETKAPYAVTVFRLGPSQVDASRRTYTSWMETLANCEASGRFPGYSDAIETIDAVESLELDFTEDET